MMNIPELYQYFLKHPRISTDSRDIAPDCLFFALKGPNFNGNDFASEALSKGAAYAIIDEQQQPPLEQFLLVDNVLDTLQKLARYHREQFDIPVLGITGSNGKTTTKELISNVLQKKYHTVFSQGNLNNHIGVPVTLLQITPSTEFAVIEMGANAPGEIAQLCEIARPNSGLITSIGKAHLGGFGSFEMIIKTKKALYDFVKNHQGICFVNADNEILTNISKETRSVVYGSGKQVKYKTRLLESTPFIHISFFAGSQEYFVKSQLIGDYNYINIQSAVAVGLENHVDPQDIVDAISQYEPRNNRSQLLKTGRNLLILDAYNANPTSMMASLESFIHLAGEAKAVILGDMLELGEYEEEEHKNILQWLRSHPEIKVFLTGPVFNKVNSEGNFIAFKDPASLRDYLFQYPLRNHTILIKGSRGIAVEKVTDAL